MEKARPGDTGSIARGQGMAQALHGSIPRTQGSVRCQIHPEGHHAILCYRESDGESLAGRTYLGMKARGIDLFYDKVCGIRNRAGII